MSASKPTPEVQKADPAYRRLPASGKKIAGRGVLLPEDKDRPLPIHLWSRKSGSLTAARDLEAVLCSVIRLPVQYWRPRFLFFGAPDQKLQHLSGGTFPAVLLPGKSHPVFTIEALPDGAGAAVCPCSSKKPYGAGAFRYIRKSCRLLHTQREMDRNSHLVEAVRINIPAALAMRLHFAGEVPPACIVQEDGL